MQNAYRPMPAPLSRGPGGWRRTRVQVGGAFLFAVVAPSFAALLLLQPASYDLIRLTTLGTLIAVLGGFYFLKNLSVFPGMRASYYVMPAFLVSYAFVLAMFLFFRLEYSRGIILGSFISCLLWTYLAYLMASREANLAIAVVPFGEAAALPDIQTVTWLPLAKPHLAVGCQALVADFSADLPDAWEAFLAESAIAGVPVFHVKQLREALTGRVEIAHLSENSFGSLIPFMGYLKVRRIYDLATAFAVGAILLPAFLLLSLIIYLDSPGPVLFRQWRVGYRGVPFQMIKFRTMNAGDDQAAPAQERAMTQFNDPRVTRVGRILRRLRIDEIPQIINILRGEMSWIGPRPEAEALSKWYQAELPFYRYRHIVPPGITGWAQVNQGHVTDLEQVSHKLHYDFYYIKNFSPWLDVLIIIRTIQTVLTGFGSK